jgi:hypothetical protein
MNAKAPFQFGLSTMLLITTLVAVILSVSLMVPGVGICLAIVSVPALVRTYILVRRKREVGKSASNQEKALLFLACACIALLIALATGAAFFVPCFVGFMAGMNIGASRANELGMGPIIGGISGTCFALPLLIYLLFIWFRYPRKKPDLNSAATQSTHASGVQLPDEPKCEQEKWQVLPPAPSEPPPEPPATQSEDAQP